MFSRTFGRIFGLTLICTTLVAGGALEAARALTDPNDYSWVTKFAAVGDSFTAGIGSGDVYSDMPDSRDCSRYDYTYPTIMNNFFGPTIKKFTYSACSGAISTGIFEQINALDVGQDLVVLTAGGNDLCLSSIISACVVWGFTSESACDAAITQAQNALGGFFKDNIKQLLTALDAKMAKNGIVVMVLYAEYFNDQTDACTDEDWRVISFGGFSLPLTKERRTRFNNLVVQTNTALQEVVDEVAASATTMTLVSANWDPWAPLTGGQFCEPGASPYPNDVSNKNVIFFKLNTDSTHHDELKRRGLDMYYGNVTSPLDAWTLEKRDPVDPGCPKPLINIPLRDGIGKIFHPNELGHEIIAAYALEAVSEARAKVLGNAASCPSLDSMTCYSSSGSTAYASAESLNNNVQDFCKYVADNAPSNEVGWSRSKNYYKGSLDEYTMVVTLSDQTAAFDENACQKAISTIINGCDVPTAGNNPMNWKGGGKRVEGQYTYAVNILRTNRPWPPPKKPTQSCAGWYKFLFQSYDIYGAGWATYDFGQQTLAKQVNPCCGSGSLTGWTFDYFDKPDENGYEWHAFFHTAIGTRRRCFDNNKVQCAAGGPCDSYCSGNG